MFTKALLPRHVLKIPQNRHVKKLTLHKIHKANSHISWSYICLNCPLCGASSFEISQPTNDTGVINLLPYLAKIKTKAFNSPFESYFNVTGHYDLLSLSLKILILNIFYIPKICIAFQ